MTSIVTFNSQLKRIAIDVSSELQECQCHRDGEIHRLYFLNFYIDIDWQYDEIKIYENGIDITHEIKKSF